MNLPRLCFVGPMLGRNPGFLPTQGETLAALLAREGYPVRQVSAKTNKYLRMLDTIMTLIVHRSDFQSLILQTYSGMGFLLTDIASLLGKWMGKRIIMHLHGGNLPSFSEKHPAWVRRVFQRADHLVAPSRFLAHELTWLGVSIHIIPNVISLSEYPFQQRSQLRPRLFWMRSFNEIYNPEMAVRVVAELMPHVPEISLSMAGPDTGALTKVQRLAGELGVSRKIQFLGFLEGPRKLQVSQDHDIYLHTNRVDNTPVSVLEIAALGLPIVATAVGGIPYLLTEGHNALFVSDGDVQGMAAAVRHLLEDPALAAQLSRNGREVVEGHSWSHVKQGWYQILRDN